MRWADLICSALVPLALTGCKTQPSRQPQVAANVHFVREPAWLGDGKWFYPQEMANLDQTGLASILPDDHLPTTTDGEIFDPTALAAAHQTLQLPAVVRVTNLQNGRQINVRVNDRGPADPARVIAVTARAAELLQFPEGGVAQVRVELLPDPTQALAAQLHGGSLQLAMKAAPVGAVATESLAPPPGARQSSRGANVALPTATAGADQDAAQVPDRLPENVTAVWPRPGQMYVMADDFGRADYAMREAAMMAPYGKVITQSQGSQERFIARGGPYPTVPAADAALKQALRLGLKAAHIVIE